MTDHTTPRGTRRRRDARGLRVGTVLSLVAVIPLVGLVSVTWRSIDDARAVAVAASRTESLAEQAVELAELDAAVFDEMVWTAVDSVVGSFQLPSEMLGQFVGTSPSAELASMTIRADELAADAGRPDIAEALGRARAARADLRVVLTEYATITVDIESSLASVLDEVTASANESTGGAALADDVEHLALAVEMRAVIAEEFYSYFASLFDVRDAPTVEIARLIELRDQYRATRAELEAHTDDDTALGSAIATLDTDPAIVGFVATIDQRITDALADGAPEEGMPLTLPMLIANTTTFATVLQAMNTSVAVMLDLVEHAVDDVLSTAGAARIDADRDIRRSYALACALALTSLVSAWVASRFIVRPLRALRCAAESLQTSQEPVRTEPVGGPAEVRAAAQAMHDAATHLDLVTRQARALASGALDAHVLDEKAPGGLGLALQHAVGTLRTALAQQDEFRRRLAHEATHDGLTKLANRNASMAQLSRSLARTTRSGGQLAVLFIDLDHFKGVNDLHGHHAGDAVLTTVAQRLVTGVREGDHVGRLGSDEFVVIAEPVEGIDDAFMLAERVLSALSEPIDAAGVTMTIGASVGIALSEGNHLTADELLRDADLAVYRAKDLGRGGIEVCNEDLRNDLAQTADLTQAIRHAIAFDELIVYYQPIVDTDTERLHALEALVRWRRPGRDGLVPPDEFIGFAERTSLIIDIDRWVLDAVIRQIAAWDTDPMYGHVPVAINVSGRHLADDDFVDHILGPLAHHGVDPNRIIIEVTESALLDDLAAAAIKLQRLRDVGIGVSIDDFGTGYTSLAHLRSLPVDILKIDRSFTSNAARNPHEASIVKLIIDTGHLLGATITAEGIETLHEAERLSALGADHLQGYYFARPQPPAELTRSEPVRAHPTV